MNDELPDVDDVNLEEQLEQIEADLKKALEPPADETGARYAWGEEVLLDALEGACIAAELDRQDSVGRLFRLVARATEALLTSNPPPGGDAEDPQDAGGDRSAANPFTYIQGLCAALLIQEPERVAALAKIDPRKETPPNVPVGEEMVQFAQALREVCRGDDAKAQEQLELLLNMSTDDMELEGLYWFRLGELLQGVLSGEGDLAELATEALYVHGAVYSGELQDDPGAFLMLPLQGVRVLAHARDRSFDYPDELDSERLEALLDAYESGIDPDELDPMIRVAVQVLLAEESLEKATEAVLVLAEDDEELAVGLTQDVAAALALITGEGREDDADISDETTLEDLVERLVEARDLEPELAAFLLEVIASEINTGEDDDDDDA